ncbi:hypothetical protein GOBAR_AA31577 [Gossypium barbadense]|uniref:Uncharacterized protein n=1 Tax=Gossypium barbadense TaxID=3634 RepID=A0A2P5WDE9_GOSBA|nr:hypothetical protein GOBAR_AA31577 [Gossypium barbadense]
MSLYLSIERDKLKSCLATTCGMKQCVKYHPVMWTLIGVGDPLTAFDSICPYSLRVSVSGRSHLKLVSYEDDNLLKMNTFLFSTATCWREINIQAL